MKGYDLWLTSQDDDDDETIERKQAAAYAREQAAIDAFEDAQSGYFGDDE